MGYALGCGRSVLRAIWCASCHAGCSQSLSLCGAAQYRTRRPTPGPRGSYCSISSRRWYLLDIVEARLHGGGLSVFSREVSNVLARGFKCTCDRWGLYRFYRVWKILSCGVLGLLSSCHVHWFCPHSPLYPVPHLPRLRCICLTVWFIVWGGEMFPVPFQRVINIRGSSEHNSLCSWRWDKTEPETHTKSAHTVLLPSASYELGPRGQLGSGGLG